MAALLLEDAELARIQVAGGLAGEGGLEDEAGREEVVDVLERDRGDAVALARQDLDQVLLGKAVEGFAGGGVAVAVALVEGGAIDPFAGLEAAAEDVLFDGQVGVAGEAAGMGFGGAISHQRSAVSFRRVRGSGVIAEDIRSISQRS